MSDIMNTDIYDITETIFDIQKNVMNDVDNEELALGINGYLNSVQSMQIQNSIITASELANEIIPSKAKFEKNVIAHAIIQNITDINAIPAKMNIMIGLVESELDNLFVDDKFIIDRESRLFIDDIEFHTDYDIIISRVLGINNKYIYSARYDNSKKNPLSKITNPYLKTPFIQENNGVTYLFIYCDIMQIQCDKVYSKLVTSTPIENKIFEFEFENQLAYFEVKVTDGNTSKYLEPVFEGIGTKQDLTDYCFYSYTDSNNIRVRFDSISYLPSLNTSIEGIVWTTIGSDGNFTYSRNFNTTLTSSRFNYKNMPIRILIGSDSVGGVDAKSVDELRKLIPKEALSRGSITNYTMLNNYFNMINTDENKIKLQKKIDNDFERSYYAYLVLKDKYNNVIPTNTFDIKVKKDQFQTNENRKYALLPGTCIHYNKNTGYGEILTDREKIKECMNNDKTDFLYSLPFMVIMTDDPLYTSYYSTIINYSSYLDFTYINYDAYLQFVAPSITWKRGFVSDNDRNLYKLTIPYTQNILVDQKMLIFDEETNKLKENNMKVFVVFYNDGEDNPYRYAEATMNTYEYKTYFNYEYSLSIRTTDQINDKNRIRIEDVYVAGTKEKSYGYFTSSVKVKIYILAKFQMGEFGRYDLDEIIPGLEGYTVCNMFTVNNNVDLYKNYTDIIRSTISHTQIRENESSYEGYIIKSVPMVKYSYMTDEECVQNFISEVDYKKAYLDNALYILENNFTIDFKLFNTYGPSKIYSLDEKGKEIVDRVNLSLTFRTKLVQSSDTYTVDYITKDIKDIIEDLNDISSLHIPNLITTITNNYRNSIEFFEFVGINEYGPGVQHLYKNESIDISTAPEFLTIHTNNDLTPDIKIILA